MQTTYPGKIVLISSLVSACLVLLMYWVTQSVFVSPDTIGLACGAEHVFAHGSFSSLRTPYVALDYVPCWTAQIYPAFQLMVAGFRFVTPSIEWSIGLVHVLLALAFPLVTSWLAWNIQRHSALTAWVAVLASIIPAVHSTLLLTPQGLFGTLLLMLSLSLVVKSHQVVWKWVLIIPLLVILFFTHTLTFFFAMVFVGIAWLIYKPVAHAVIIFLATLGIGVVGSLAALARDSSIFNIISGLWQQLHIIDQFQQRSLLDHASVFGYVIMPLAAFGFLSGGWKKKQRVLLGVLVGLPLILSHLDLVGLSFLPHRMIWYVAPALILLAGSGMASLLTQERQWVKGVCGALVVLSLSLHTVWSDMNIKSIYSEPIQLHTDYSEVIHFLQTQPSDQIVLTIMTPQDRQNLYLPQLISADVISFPAHQFKDPKQFELAQPFWTYLAEHSPSEPFIQRLKEISLMVEQPKQAQEQNVFSAFKVSSVVLHKGSSEAKQYKKNEIGQLVFENDSYLIYQL